MHTLMHAWIHACMHTYILIHSYMPDADIQTDSHICLPTNTHTSHTYKYDFSISRFLYFWNFHTSTSQDMWKSGNSRNTEIQKTGDMYVCWKGYIFVCMYKCKNVGMYQDEYGVDRLSTANTPFKANKSIPS